MECHPISSNPWYHKLVARTGYHLPALNKKTSYINGFSYDTIGNITQKVQTHFVSGSQDPIETNYQWNYKYNGAQPHAVTDTFDVQTNVWLKNFSYDDDGNMLGWASKTSNASRTITWNEENRVKNITDSGNGTSFLYDDQGERVTKRGSGNETVYVNRFYAVKNGDLGTKHIFAGETRVTTKLEKDGGSIQSGVPGANAFNVSQGLQNAISNGNGQKKGIYRRLNGTGTGTGTTNPPIEKFEFFYHGDHLGSSNFITDDLGAVYQDLEYFPYGETWVEDGGSGQMPMYRFTGKELDPETGLYYFGARYYDPVLSRWISADPALEQFLPKAGIAAETSNNLKAGSGMKSDSIPKYASASWVLRNYSWTIRSESGKDDKDISTMTVKTNKLSKPDSRIYEPIVSNLYSYARNNPIAYLDPDGNADINVLTDKSLSTYVEKMPRSLAGLKNKIETPVRDIDKLLHYHVGETPGSVTIKAQPTLTPGTDLKNFDMSKVGYGVSAEGKFPLGSLGHYQLNLDFKAEYNNVPSATPGGPATESGSFMFNIHTDF